MSNRPPMVDRQRSGPFLRLAALCLALVVSSCSTPPPPPPPPPVPVVDAAKSTVTIDRETGVLATGADVVTVSITVHSTTDQPMPGQTVSVEISGSAVTLSAPSATTDDNGLAQLTFTSTAVGRKTVSARSGEVTLSQAPSVTFVAGPAASLVFTIPPGTTAARTAISPSPQVALRDANGNAVTDNATLTVSLTGGDPSARLTGPLSVTLVDGIATLSGLQIDRPGSAYALVVTSPGLAQALSAPFDVTASAPPRLAFVVAAPTSTTAGAALTPALTVALRDSQGQLLTAATAPVTLALSSGPLGGVVIAQPVDGLATFDTLHIDRAGTNYTIVATAPGFASATSAPFNVAAAAPSRLAFTTQPSSAAVGAALAPPVAVTVFDAFDNVATTSTSAIMLTISSSNGAILSGGEAIAPSNGVASFASLTVDRAGTGCTLTASSAGLGPDTSSAFTITSATPVAINTTVVASPSTGVVANGTSISTITVTALDGTGSPVPGLAVSLVATGSGNVLTQPVAVTNASGVATGTLASVSAGDKVVTATLNPGPSQLVVAQQPTVAFVAGAPSVSASTIVATSPVVADGASPSFVTVTVRDAFGNPVQGTTVVVATGAAGDVITQPAASSDANGTATGSVASTSAGPRTVSATVNGLLLAGAGSIVFVAGAPSASHSTVQVTSPIVADGVATSLVTLTVRDVRDNPVPGLSLTIGSSNPTDTVQQPTATTGSGGTTTATVSSVTVGATSVRITTPGLASVTPAVVQFVPGAPSATTSTITATSPVVADGVATSSITVTVLDALGHPLPGRQVIIASSRGSDTVMQPASATGANGIATGTVASTFAESKTITAQVDGVPLSASAAVNFVASVPVAATFTASPGVVGVGATTVLTVTVRDAFGNFAPGAAVSLASTGSNNTFTPQSGTTDTLGVFTATMSSTKAELKSLTATVAASVNVTSSVTFVVGPVQQFRFLVQPTSKAVGVAFLPALRGELTDAFGNRVTTATNAVTLRVTGNAGLTVANGGPRTPVNGVVTFLGANLTQAGTNYRLYGSASGLTSEDSSPFSVIVPSRPQCFSAPAGIRSREVYQLHAADVDQDGWLDLVTANNQWGLGGNTPTLERQLNTGPGSFVLGGEVSFHDDFHVGTLQPYASTYVAPGGVRNLVWAGPYMDNFAEQPALAFGTGWPPPGIPVFLPSQSILAQGFSGLPRLVSADVNHDGFEDVIVGVDTTAPSAYVFMANGLGSFAAVTGSVSIGPASGSSTRQMLAGDFNEDGNIDIATANGGVNTFTIVFGLGDGTFPTRLTIPGGWVGTSDLAAGDFNNDGHLDLALASLQHIGVFLNNGAAVFTPQPDVSTQPNDRLLVGDVNGDNAADLVTRSQTMLGNGNGTFRTPINREGAAGDLVLGDFTRDGKLDLARCVERASSIFVSPGLGDGRFKTPIITPIAPALVWQATAGDFNEDGKSDLVVDNALRLGNGDGTFQPPQSLGFRPTDGLLTVDWNGDGHLDLLLRRPDFADRAHVLALGQGDGTFLDGPLVPFTPFVTVNTAMADFNGDGRNDLIVTAGPGGDARLMIFLTQTSGPLVLASSLQLPNTAETYDGLAVADFNADGKMDAVVGGITRDAMLVFHGVGDGTLVAGPALSAIPAFPPNGPGGYSTDNLSAGDFNRDGKGEIVLIRSKRNAVTSLLIFHGQTNGGFSAPVESPLDTNLAIINPITEDFDGDGWLDIGGASASNSTMTFLNNRDGTFSLIQLPGGGPGAVSAFSDFNGDGRFDVASTSYVSSGHTLTVVLGVACGP